MDGRGILGHSSHQYDVVVEDLEESIVGGNRVREDVISNTSLTTNRLKRYFKNMGKSVFTKKTLNKRLPVSAWGPQYDLDCLQGDILAGITVGLTVIPQGIAYAIVAGVPANYGLYSAFMGCFVYMFFGSSKDITIGPTAIMSLMTHEYTKNLECHEDPEALASMAVLLAFLTGLIILAATVLRIGFLITFIGRTVIIGFTSAAAITIATSQVKGFLGISIDAEGFVNTWVEIFKHITETKWQDATLGLICCIVLLLMKEVRNLEITKPQPTDGLGAKVWKKTVFICSVGRNAIVVMVCCLIAYLCRASQPFEITGFIEPGFPKVGLPSFTLSCNSSNSTYESYSFIEVTQMFGSGLFIVPIIAILEDIAIASAFSGGKAIDATQEMLALGLCNFLGSFFQSIPTTGSFSRTAVNSTSGVKTQAGGVATGLLVILALLFLTPVFQYIPKSALSAVIICAVIFMVEYHDIIPIWKTYRLDQIPLWTTFLVCLFWKLEWGILVGTAVNIGMLLYLQAQPNITVIVKQSLESQDTAVVVVTPSLGLMFPSAEYVKKKVSDAGLEHMPLIVVMDCSHASSMDYTSGLAMRNLHKELSSRNQKVQFSNMNIKVRNTLRTLIPDMEEVTLLSPDMQVAPTANGVEEQHPGNGLSDHQIDYNSSPPTSVKFEEGPAIKANATTPRTSLSNEAGEGSSEEGVDEPLLNEGDKPVIVSSAKKV